MEYIFLISLLCIALPHGFHAEKCDYGCTFNGREYKEGDEREFGCFGFRCSNKEWEYIYNNLNCLKCEITQDPHFYTFHQFAYDFHGESGIITAIASSGIYGYFKKCSLGSQATCLHSTFYILSNSLIIEISHSKHIELLINGNSVYRDKSPVAYCSDFTSTIVWTDERSVYIVGTYFTIIASARNMIIYSYEENLREMKGLCVSNSDRYLAEGRLSLLGPLESQIQEGRLSLLGPLESQIQLKECNKEKAREICRKVIKASGNYCSEGHTEKDVIRILENCVKDCCYSGIENCDEWAEAGSEVLCILSDLFQNAKYEGAFKREKEPLELYTPL